MNLYPNYERLQSEQLSRLSGRKELLSFLVAATTLNIERLEIVQTAESKWRISWRDSFVGQI